MRILIFTLISIFWVIPTPGAELIWQCGDFDLKLEGMPDHVVDVDNLPQAIVKDNIDPSETLYPTIFSPAEYGVRTTNHQFDTNGNYIGTTRGISLGYGLTIFVSPRDADLRLRVTRVYHNGKTQSAYDRCAARSGNNMIMQQKKMKNNDGQVGLLDCFAERFMEDHQFTDREQESKIVKHDKAIVVRNNNLEVNCSPVLPNNREVYDRYRESIKLIEDKKATLRSGVIQEPGTQEATENQM